MRWFFNERVKIFLNKILTSNRLKRWTGWYGKSIISCIFRLSFDNNSVFLFISYLFIYLFWLNNLRTLYTDACHQPWSSSVVPEATIQHSRWHFTTQRRSVSTIRSKFGESTISIELFAKIRHFNIWKHKMENIPFSPFSSLAFNCKFVTFVPFSLFVCIDFLFLNCTVVLTVCL